ncbi:MAG: alpha amylase family protein [Armatimonadota bacterium]
MKFSDVLPCLPGKRLAASLLSAALGAAALLSAAPRAESQTLAPAKADGVGQAVSRHAGLEGRVLWLDGTANLQRLSTREGVARVLDRCVRARVNTIVVDVKPLSGHVLYPSEVAPRLKEWQGFTYPENHDLLQVVLEEGHKRGLKVHANINVFSAGHKLVGVGPAYERPELQSVIYEVERTFTTPRGDRRRVMIGLNRVPGHGELGIYDASNKLSRVFDVAEAFALVIKNRVEAVVTGGLAPAEGVKPPRDGYLIIGRGESARWLLERVQVGDELTWTATDRFMPIVESPSETVAAFVNPADPGPREMLLRLVDELVTKYPVDGVVFDRMRYASLQSDFSLYSRAKFEEYLGQKLNRFPEDIYSFDPTPGRPIVQGPYFKQWLEWRARNIRSWLEQASALVRKKRPEAKLGAYVGSWYPSYYTVGVNWGSDEVGPRYDWMTPGYHATGYAGLLDWITTGCYHPVATREEARRAGQDELNTVQAAAEVSTRAVGDAAFFYAGLYLVDYQGKPEAFRKAMQAARDYSHGVMIFDLVHLENFDWWNLVESEFRKPALAPHDVPALQDAIRNLRRAVGAASRPQLP